MEKIYYPLKETDQQGKDLADAGEDLHSALLVKKPRSKRELLRLKEKNEKLRFVRAVGATLQHEIFNPLQAIVFANHSIASTSGESTHTKTIIESATCIRDTVKKLISLLDIQEVRYPGDDSILILAGDEDKCSKAKRRS